MLREEPQYRLLFAGQVLSILGDRVTGVVLPFAVLAVGGGVGDVALVSAAQFIPFALLALPAGVWADRYDRKRILITSDVARFVCQLSGAGDYGTAWDGPWAMAYPDGTEPTTETVHPTPIYETLAMGLVTYVLWRLRFAFRPGLLFALYLVLAGAERFLIEFIRRNDDVAVGLTEAQLISVAMILAGGVWLAVKANRGELRTGPAPAAQT